MLDAIDDRPPGIWSDQPHLRAGLAEGQRLAAADAAIADHETEALLQLKENRKVWHIHSR